MNYIRTRCRLKGGGLVDGNNVGIANPDVQLYTCTSAVRISFVDSKPDYSKGGN